jgi:hypothetical protein
MKPEGGATAIVKRVFNFLSLLPDVREEKWNSEHTGFRGRKFVYVIKILRDATSYGMENVLNGKFYGKFRYQQLDKPRTWYADLTCPVANNELYTQSGQVCWGV